MADTLDAITTDRPYWPAAPPDRAGETIASDAGSQFDPRVVEEATMASVLIVDDDPFIRRLVSTTLEDVAGFEPVEAAGGTEALALARSEPPALVFLDIDMPGIDGHEVCRGAYPFLTKPFSPLERPRLVHDLGNGGAAA